MFSVQGGSSAEEIRTAVRPVPLVLPFQQWCEICSFFTRSEHVCAAPLISLDYDMYTSKPPRYRTSRRLKTGASWEC